MSIYNAPLERPFGGPDHAFHAPSSWLVARTMELRTGNRLVVGGVAYLLQMSTKSLSCRMTRPKIFITVFFASKHDFVAA